MSRDQVVLFVDCEETAREILEPRGPIDANGNISISKLSNTKQTVPVSIVFFL